MLKLLLPLALAAALPAAAAAQATSDAMTCSQAVALFARDGVIYKRSGNQVLPIRIGTPIEAARGMRCGRARAVLRYTVPTADNPRCVISAYCN